MLSCARIIELLRLAGAYRICSVMASCSIQGDLDGWMNLTDPNDDTLTYNATGLVRPPFRPSRLPSSGLTL